MISLKVIHLKVEIVKNLSDPFIASTDELEYGKMMITMGCMRMVLTRVMFLGMLGLTGFGATLSVPSAGFASETETNAAAAKDAVPMAAEYTNPEYLRFRLGAEVPRVQQAMLMYDAENYELAYDIFLMEAESGNPHAQFMIARYYEQGLGRPVNILESLKWYRKAALNGHIVVHHNLGVIFEKGIGVPVNYRDALFHFKFAAERCFVPSQYGMATVLVRLPKKIRNYSEVHMWLEIAAALGYGEAIFKSEQLHKAGTTSHELKHGKEKAQKWLESHSCE